MNFWLKRKKRIRKNQIMRHIFLLFPVFNRTIIYFECQSREILNPDMSNEFVFIG